jgi:hypothetical protein
MYFRALFANIVAYVYISYLNWNNSMFTVFLVMSEYTVFSSATFLRILFFVLVLHKKMPRHWIHIQSLTCSVRSLVESGHVNGCAVFSPRKLELITRYLLCSECSFWHLNSRVSIKYKKQNVFMLKNYEIPKYTHRRRSHSIHFNSY